jgi:peptidoglycan/xylan/chitin deacetylase (PgdA/CDA1 family)
MLVCKEKVKMKKWLVAILVLMMASMLMGFMYMKDKRPWMQTDGTPILMYHAISEAGPEVTEDAKEWYVTEEDFKEQMQHLKDKGYTLLTFEEFDDAKKYDKPIFVTLDDGYADNMNAFKILKELEDETFKPKATLFMFANKVNEKNFLTAEQLKEMSDSGIISVQSHTSNHIDLAGQNVKYDVEYKNSKEKLEAITNKPINALAYPFGSFNEKAVEEAAKHYEYAVIMGHTRFQLKDEPNELHTLERLTVSGHDSMFKFKLMVR